MRFRTEIPASRSDFLLSYEQQILSLGSCFAERMGQRLIDSKFSALCNPLGICYHPLALSKLLRMGLGLISAPQLSYAEHMGLWHSFDLHGSFRALESGVLRSSIDQQLATLKAHLSKTDVLLLTLGTAWVYQEKESGKMVANCHKYPSARFAKRLLSVDEIVADYERLFADLRAHRPDLQIILTLSPVRHERDTLVLNSVSKSVLRLAAHQLSESVAGVDYYPAYELVMDDLRDYRYYAEDLLHPNAQAEQYIWEHFGASYFDDKTQTLLKRWEKLRQGLSHRPFQPEGEAHQKFLQNLLTKLSDLGRELPLEAEIAEIRSRLEAFASS
ncbi:MAG: GSCFA domain-containing protein [Bacteroidota bacterium]